MQFIQKIFKIDGNDKKAAALSAVTLWGNFKNCFIGYPCQLVCQLFYMDFYLYDCLIPNGEDEGGSVQLYGVHFHSGRHRRICFCYRYLTGNGIFPLSFRKHLLKFEYSIGTGVLPGIFFVFWYFFEFWCLMCKYLPGRKAPRIQ